MTKRVMNIGVSDVTASVLYHGPALLILGLWLLGNVLTLTRFPTVYMDEANYANHAYNAAFHGQSVFSLYDDLFPKPFYFLRQTWPIVIRPFFVYPLSVYFRAVGYSFFKARLLSVLTGAACLLGVYAAGLFLGRRRSALAAMGLLATNFLFLYSSHTVGPEISLCLCGLLAFLSLIKGLRDSSIPFLAASGFLAGLAPGFHTNGLGLIAALVLVILQQKKSRALGSVFLGWALGLGLFLLCSDWSRFFSGYSMLFMKEMTRPPLLKYHGNTLAAFADEASRYNGSWIYRLWANGPWLTRAMSAWHMVYVAGVLIALMLPRSPWKIPALFGAGLMLTFALLVGQKAANYLVVLNPYFCLCLAGGITADRPDFVPRSFFRAGRAFVWTVTLALTVISLGFAAGVYRYQPSLPDLCTRIKSEIPAEAKVAGPQALWLGLDHYEYRDLGAVVWYRLFMNQKNLWQPLVAFHPDYLLVDQSMASRWLRMARLPGQPRMQAPTGFLPWPHHVLDVIDVGPAYGDHIAVIQIDWKTPPR